ncbi:MAG: lipocalin family protein [Bacteroidaceae bacterium]|nr:lipocalin family protein [Bacteroidaceae bacterium]
MKKIINILMLALIAVCTSCTPEETPEPTLPVNTYNLDGTWQLDQLNDAPLADSTYLYIVLDRKGTFSIYTNLSSMYPVMQTGKFTIEEDWRIGSIISGTYDFDLGAWNHEYIITDLYKESMVWTAKDDATDVQKFVRVADVPEHITEAVRPVEK